MSTMTWELVERIFQTVLQETVGKDRRWRVFSYRKSSRIKMKTKKVQDDLAIQQPVEAEDLQATDWCLRLKPPYTFTQMRDFVIDTNDNHFEIVIGQSRRTVVIAVGDNTVPLSVNHPEAPEYIAAEIKMLIEQACAA